MPTSQGGSCDLRPGFPVAVNSDFDPSFAPFNFAEDLRTGVRVFRGETRLLALDFAEDRDLLEFALAKGFVN